jgi:hypothetical protein
MHSKILFYMYHIAILSALAFLAVGCGKSESRIRESAVMLKGMLGTCSGEQVVAPSGKRYILSAGHCADLADSFGNIQVLTQDGQKIMRKVIEEDVTSDLLLIEGVPGLPALSIARETSQFVRTFTHGNGHALYKTEGEMLETALAQMPVFIIMSPEQRARCNTEAPDSKYEIVTIASPTGTMNICIISLDETVTSAKIVPGSSGGMAVDSNGDLMGVVSAADGNFGFLVTLDDIKDFLSSQ